MLGMETNEACCGMLIALVRDKQKMTLRGMQAGVEETMGGCALVGHRKRWRMSDEKFLWESVEQLWESREKVKVHSSRVGVQTKLWKQIF